MQTDSGFQKIRLVLFKKLILDMSWLLVLEGSSGASSRRDHDQAPAYIGETVWFLSLEVCMLCPDSVL